MKRVYLRLAACAASLILALMWLTGCDDGGNSGGGTNNVTNAPVSLAGKDVTHTITTGTPPFPSSGTFVLHVGGAPGVTTGSYTITGSGAATNSSGTYTYVMTSGNTASLVLQDSVFGQVNESMTFQTPAAGTFSSSTGSGGTEGGSFITD